MTPNAAPIAPPAAEPPSRPDAAWPETAFTRWLVRWRHWFFVGLAVLLVAMFNGHWRLGLDTSIYRGVADSLAAGNGYRFNGRPQTQVYPGLPVMLAALQRGLGTTSLVPPLIVMNALALATLAGVYQLIKLRYPVWIAVVVTCGVGMNARFLLQAQEIMTDTPFLAAVVAALLGWEWLALVHGRRRVAGATALLVVGLFVAATMRPTFWVLAVAWGLVAAWNSLVRREKRSMIALAALAVAGLAFVVIDPRVHGGKFLQGAYEQELLHLTDTATRMAKNAPNLVNRELPEAFFGETMSHVSLPFVLLLIFGAVLVVRRQPLWGLQVFILSAVMLVLSDVPRYYLMVLPTLWLGYVLAPLALTARLPLKYRDWVLFALFSVANFQNLSGCLALFHDQHARNFDATFKSTSYDGLRQMAAVLKEQMKPGEVALAPNAQILAYLSGRDVVNGRLLNFETTPASKYPARIASANPTYLVGPLEAYEAKDKELFRLLSAGLIQPGRLVAFTPDKSMWVATAVLKMPGENVDWRKLPTTRRLTWNGPPKKANHTAAAMAHRKAKTARKNRTLRAARLVHRAKQERKQRIKRRQATTQPAAVPLPGTLVPPAALSAPSSVPARLPVSRPATPVASPGG